MTIILPVWIAFLIAACAIRARKSAREWQNFKATHQTRERQRFYRRWLLEGVVLLDFGSIITIVLLHEKTSSWPYLTLPLSGQLVPEIEISGAFVAGLLSGLAILLLGLWLNFKFRQKSLNVTLGDFESLIPRTRKEAGLALLLCLNAGIGEELFFRFALPLLIARFSSSLIAGAIASTALFGLMHWYQGWKGILATTFLGAVFMTRALHGTSLPALMAVHALIDIFGLFVRPAVSGKFSRRAAQPSS